MGKLWRLLLCLVLVIQVQAVTRPPGIYEQPDYDVYYKAGETVAMPCKADGSPTPTYTWQRNGIDFDPSGNDDRVVQLADEGTIMITKPEDKDEGIFQCFAHNAYGTSLSININLREVVLEDFEEGGDIVERVNLGHQLVLGCVPPDSIPPPDVWWSIKTDTSNIPVSYDDRVTMDIEYRLNFANVIEEDEVNGASYVCMVRNPNMRQLVQSPGYIIKTHGVSEKRPAEYLWSSPKDHYGLRGDTFRVKCIFQGNPTPDVHWERIDGAPLSDDAMIRSYGQELVINDLKFEDAGVYECWATNTETTTRAQRTIDVRVESRPFWLLEPQDVEISIGGTAVINCLAKAVPEAKYIWFINGVPYEDSTDQRVKNNPRFRFARSDRIVFTDLTREDTMVIQCNATNKHGYVFGDVWINVLSEAPTIIKPPDQRKVVAEGTSINVTCQVTGKPDPIITWFKDEQQITGGHYEVLTTGDLFIRKVVLSDAGLYRCEAENKFNKTMKSGLLLVRRKTLIEQAPMDLEVNVGTDAKFTCSATTDPEEVDNLEIKWLKDNKEISMGEQRMATNFQDNSLTISGTLGRDSGSYTCIATNGLDFSSASAMLTVKKRPEAASEVVIKECRNGNATVSWMPGSYNNAPIQYYIVQYSTHFSPDTWTFAGQVNASQSSLVDIRLSPWATYRFRVIAYNKIGESTPSNSSSQTCTTSEAVPDENPQNLRSIGDRKGYLHIEWTPMPQIKHNDAGFHYLLTVLKDGFDDTNVSPITINDWREHEYLYATGENLYEAYIIKLQAKNNKGSARQEPSEIRGFPGEDIPTEPCKDVVADEIGDTYAVLKWTFPADQIDVSGTTIRGEFRGFKIQFWQQGDRDNTLREYDLLKEDALASSVGDTFTARVDHLLPFTNLEATVAVMNNYYVAKPSDVCRFRTQPGFPGPVDLFRPINIGDNHVNLEWTPPEENRGDILGYDIGYQSVHGLDLGEIQERDPQINDPFATMAMLSGLLMNTRYRVYIWARTVKGRGEGYFIELITSKAGDPQAPRFTITDVGRNHINISWWINPYATSGTVVYVEFRKEDAAEWQRSTDEVISTWKDILNLEAGSTYEVRVVATNGGDSRTSHIEEVTTDGIALASALVGNWGWFLGMMLALFLLIGLIIFFVILFKQGKRFQQQDSPSNSYYAGDAGSYSGTYGHNTTGIPKRSADFGGEPRGYSNDYYDDRDKGYYHDDRGGGGAARRYDDDDDQGGFEDRRRDYDKRYDDDHHHDDYYDRRGYDDDKYYDDNRRDHYNDKRDHYDDDRRDRYDDRRSDRDDYDRYRPPSYSDLGDPHSDSRDAPYEDYERKPSGNYDPDVDNRDYREPNRFDRQGAPKSEKPGASSTFV